MPNRSQATINDLSSDLRVPIVVIPSDMIRLLFRRMGPFYKGSIERILPIGDFGVATDPWMTARDSRNSYLELGKGMEQRRISP